MTNYSSNFINNDLLNTNESPHNKTYKDNLNLETVLDEDEDEDQNLENKHKNKKTLEKIEDNSLNDNKNNKEKKRIKEKTIISLTNSKKSKELKKNVEELKNKQNEDYRTLSDHEISLDDNDESKIKQKNTKKKKIKKHQSKGHLNENNNENKIETKGNNENKENEDYKTHSHYENHENNIEDHEDSKIKHKSAKKKIKKHQKKHQTKQHLNEKENENKKEKEKEKENEDYKTHSHHENNIEDHENLKNKHKSTKKKKIKKHQNKGHLNDNDNDNENDNENLIKEKNKIKDENSPKLKTKNSKVSINHRTSNIEDNVYEKINEESKQNDNLKKRNTTKLSIQKSVTSITQSHKYSRSNTITNNRTKSIVKSLKSFSTFKSEKKNFRRHSTHQMDDKIHVLFCVYAPGTNKDEVIFNEFKKQSFVKISILSLLNENIEHEKYGKTITDYLGKEKRVPSEIIVYLIDEKIESSKHFFTRFLICGFPSIDEDIQWYRKTIGKKYNEIGLIYVTYSKEEYILEKKENARMLDLDFDHSKFLNSFLFFIKNTQNVLYEFNEKKIIRVS